MSGCTSDGWCTDSDEETHSDDVRSPCVARLALQISVALLPQATPRTCRVAMVRCATMGHSLGTALAYQTATWASHRPWRPLRCARVA